MLRMTHENEIRNPGFSEPSTFLEGLTQETGKDDTFLDRLHPGTPSGPESVMRLSLCHEGTGR